MDMLRVSDYIAAYEVADKWSGEVNISPYIVRLFEAVRYEIGKPIIITSGYRTEEYQQHLRDIGYPTADMSPHCWGAALDMLYPFGICKDEFALLFREKSQELGYGRCRLGRKKYEGIFLHADVIYLLFKPYTTISNPKSGVWEEGVEW